MGNFKGFIKLFRLLPIRDKIRSSSVVSERSSSLCSVRHKVLREGLSREDRAMHEDTRRDAKKKNCSLMRTVIPYVVLVLFLAITISISPKPGALPGNTKVDKIIVIKSKRILQIFYKEKLIKTYKVALGKNSRGHKQFEGDNKTPEGTYYINDKNPHSKFHRNLGISYPNKQDIARAKKLGKSPGGQIKIHGLKNGLGWLGNAHRLLNWTGGCIAVTNQEIEELYRIIKIGTPIIIKP